MNIGISHEIIYEELLTESGETILTEAGEPILIGVRLNLPLRIYIKRACQGYYLRWYYNGWHYWFFLPGKLFFATEGEEYRTIGTRKIAMGTGQITGEQVKAIRTIMNTREIGMLTDAGWMNIRIEPGSVVIFGNQVDGYEFDFTAIVGSRDPSISGFSPVIDVPVVPPVPDPGICEGVIGTQIWMCKNYDSNYPGSKVYDDDEANRAIYGGLYTFAQMMSTGFCPAGWHVPSNDEWYILIAYAGGLAVAGGKLKEIGTTHWNAGIDGTDDFGFTALGAGCYDGGFIEKLIETRLRTSSATYDPDKTWSVRMNYNSNALTVSLNITDWDNYLPVRLIKDVAAPPLSLIYDKDGNAYHQVIVGAQIWIVENLRTTKYADNSAIPEIILDAAWAADITGAYCAYNDDPLNIPDYGLLYNWYAVDNAAGLCYFEDALGNPLPGWRIPIDADYDTLSTYLGGDAISGGKLKEVGTAHWGINSGATNSSGFTAVGAGYRLSAGTFAQITFYNVLWSSVMIGANGYYRIIRGSGPQFTEDNYSKNGGMSIRCVKDV